MGLVGHVALWVRGQVRCLQGFGAETLREKTLVRPKRRWDDYIKIDLQEGVMDCMYWIDLAGDKDRCWVVVNEVINCRILYNAGNF
jgi:hypothetical protein